MDDNTNLTSFNPFSEEDEIESSYALVTSLFSRVKNTLTVPLTSRSHIQSNHTSSSSETGNWNNSNSQHVDPVAKHTDNHKSRPFSNLTSSAATLAPPLMSVVPAVSEMPVFYVDYEGQPSRSTFSYSSAMDNHDGGLFSSIPGFPIADDTKSIHTATLSLKRTVSVSRIIRRIRGEGLSREYWMDDENCKECYDCKGIFTAWRRKHHCRICGQIFCSRCASNVIKASRFGVDGMIRVCNLCLEKIHTDSEDDDDRRSVASYMSSPFFSQQPVNDYYTVDLLNQSRSPFSASQMFGRTDEPYNLFSIPETERHSIDRAAVTERELQNTPAAPFRRSLNDDEKDSLFISDSFIREQHNSTVKLVRGDPSITAEKNDPTISDGIINTVQFPVMSSSVHTGSDTAFHALKISRNTEDLSPFLRHRVHSRMGEGEPGWRTRTESTAYAQELNQISMLHLRIMIRQMLSSNYVRNNQEWEEVLLKLCLRVARDLSFSTTYREGTEMDIRRYIKIKKIPGGSPHDSEYVDGAVITKSIAHKRMSRLQNNPRIVFVTFPLEFQRVEGQYMPFGQILRQEKEYLGNLASRIAALRPHLVLVEKSVSRLALDALAMRNITVAKNLKKSAMLLVSRMTQGDLLSSMDMLAAEPRLGHCSRFRIQMFDHPLIPGQRKSYMRFEGCNRDVGCTIVLRGGNLEELKRIKRVTRFIMFIVRNLKLETHLWKDSVLTLPQLTAKAVPNSSLDRLKSSNSESGVDSDGSSEHGEQAPPKHNTDIISDDEVYQLSRQIQNSLNPYLNTFISISSTLRFPPPYPISRMKELDIELVDAHRGGGQKARIFEERDIAERPTTFCEQNDPLNIPKEQCIQKAHGNNSEYPDQSVNPEYVRLDQCLPSLSMISLSPPEKSDLYDPLEPRVLKHEADIAFESALESIKDEHTEQRRIWEWYLRKNRDDFDVEKYQCITILQFTVPISDLGHRRACYPPEIKCLTFYGKNDCTLGQFIEKAIRDTLIQIVDMKAICGGKGCNENNARHCQVLIHHESRLTIFVEQWRGEFKAQANDDLYPDLITTWSACRVCGSATPFIPVSAEMQRYSFAKFLELHFYPADVKLIEGAGCMHNIYQHHVRYFSFKGFTVRFQTDPIVLYEVVYPPIRVRVRQETLLRLKNADFDILRRLIGQWYGALIGDLKLINLDAISGEEESDIKLTAEINAWISRAYAESEDMYRLLEKVYSESSPTNALALNLVRARRQDRIVAWQQDFENLAKLRESQNIKRSYGKSSAFGSVRAIWTKRQDVIDAQPILRDSSPQISGNEEPRSNMEGLASIAPSSSDLSGSELSSELMNDHASVVSSPIMLDDINAGHIEPESCSDLTISASQEEIALSTADRETDDNSNQSYARATSRLPRRPGHHATVADLVQRFQNKVYSSPQENAAEVTGNVDFVAESPSDHKNYDRHDSIRKKESTKCNDGGKRVNEYPISDFEQGYAVNVAPNYLTHKRPDKDTSRIPGPAIPLKSREALRHMLDDEEKKLDTNKSSSIGNVDRNTGVLDVLLQHASEDENNANQGKGKNLSTSPNTSKDGQSESKKINFNSKVSNITWQFEQMRKKSEQVNHRYAVIRGRRARPVASASAKVEVFHSVRDAIKDEPDLFESSNEADEDDEDEDENNSQINANSPDMTTNFQSPLEPASDSNNSISHSEIPLPEEMTETSGLNNLTLHLSNDVSSESGSDLQLSQQATEHSKTRSMSEIGSLDTENVVERHSTIMRALSGLWPPNAPISYRLDFERENTMTDPEHIFRDASMVVRTDEPTSIIALALNSLQYREMLSKSRTEKRMFNKSQVVDGGVFMSDDSRAATENSSPIRELRNPLSKLPWAFSFESGNLTITCTMLYPEHFDALRRTYECDEALVQSLARCVKWNASGGKSGSAFLKTLDDRFIAKEITRAELETMELFAPAYFDYVSSAVMANRPTLLAKIFGCYKLVFRRVFSGKEKMHKSKAMQMNLLVMENLFYDRHFSKIFDLKGSTRNRHVHSTGKEDEVLLDENLVEISHLIPFYVREHSKRILRGALYNDSKFLADLNIMDYSLVVGIDSSGKELVTGIVDYIRTYTWDKKLESWVKESTFLGGSGKGEPTIVSPKQYRQRFISAMERYFPLVPDRWMKQKDAEEEGENLDLWPDW